MQQIQKIFRCYLICATVLLLPGCSSSEIPHKLTPGNVLPDLQIKDLKGHDFTLNAISEKTRIINIWATWCAPCRFEMPSLDRLNKSLDSEKFTVVGISIDEDDHLVREFLIERKIEFTNYLDQDMNEVKDKLHIRALPSTLIVNPQGKLLKLVEGGRHWDTVEMVKMIQTLN